MFAQPHPTRANAAEAAADAAAGELAYEHERAHAEVPLSNKTQESF